MSQARTAEYASKDDSNSKDLDFAFVISGWPTIYTVVKENYTLAGDFSNFAAAKAWASLPVGVGAGVKGRPEEGGLTIGELEVTLADRQIGGVRMISDLVARESYLQANRDAAGEPTRLNGDHAPWDTAIRFTGNLPAAPGKVYVGLECIAYTGNDGATLTGLSRGHLLTSVTPHPDQAFVYTFPPSLFRRKAFLYKGYQNLGTEHWLPAFGGVIAGVEKRGPAVAFRVMSTTWNTYSDGRTVAFQWKNPDITIENHALSHDYSVQAEVSSGSSIGNGHYLVKLAGGWNAIKGIT